MKFIATTDTFSEALSFLSRLTKGRMARVRPIMGCVRIVCEAKAKAIRMEAHNGEQWASVVFDQVDVQDPGACAVSCDMLARAVGNCGAAPTVTCEIEADQRLAVRGDHCITRLWTQDAKDFPPPVSLGAEHKALNIDAPALLSCLGRAIGCTGTDSSRFSMMGVRVRHTGRKLNFAATNGKIAAITETTVAEKAAKPLQHIVPNDAVRLVMVRLEKWQEGEPVRVHFGENGCGFTVGNVEVRSASLEGTFIPIEDHAPAKSDKTIEIDAAALASSVRAAGMFADDSFGTRCIRVTPNGTGVSISSGQPESGDYCGTVDAAIAGDPPAFGTQALYILEAIRGVGLPVIRLEVTTANKPIAARTTSGDYIVFWQPLSMGT